MYNGVEPQSLIYPPTAGERLILNFLKLPDANKVYPDLSGLSP